MGMMLDPDVSTSFHRFPTGVAGRRSACCNFLLTPLSLSRLQFLLFSLRFVVGGGF